MTSYTGQKDAARTPTYNNTSNHICCTRIFYRTSQLVSYYKPASATHRSVDDVSITREILKSARLCSTIRKDSNTSQLCNGFLGFHI